MKANNKIQYNAAYDLLTRNLKNNKIKTAFIDYKTTISYEELYLKVQNFAQNIKKQGFRENDRLIICLHDTIDFPVCFLGAIWAGVIPICINTMLPLKEYEYILKDSQAKGAIISFNLLKPFITLKETIRKDFYLICDEDSSNINQCIDLKSLTNVKSNDNIDPAKTYKDTVCFWLYSSGSTGSPKGTLHVHKSLIATAETYAKKVLNIHADDICFSAAKLFFAYGLGNALTFPMSVGATSVLMKDRPTVEKVTNIINKYNISIFYGVPTLYASILNSTFERCKFKSLRVSISAGEALPAHLCEKWISLLGTEVLDGIGSTEMLHIFISNTLKKVVPGSSGKPVPGYKARLIKDDGSEAINDEIGELEIQGPSSAIAYWKKDKKTKDTFKKNWTKTGDKYIRNNEGIFTYCGRADDMMKVSGQYVSPFEIEASLQNNLNVLEVAVVGKKDKDALIKPKAFIVLSKKNINVKMLQVELTNHVKQQLSPFKYPRWYEFVDE